ncbi:HTH domain-containing protein [Enterococcus faecium]|nr:HTH domain-containing protein [Enterococcus faecium]MDQ8422243.1 HTH domain-containing protein [Enterococcus faecium]MDQ8505511.1 HTH domain-containing protein [Enterococcus faecium]
MGIEFSERQMKILYFLIENEHTTYKELSEQLYVSTKTISKDILILKEIIQKMPDVQMLVQPKKRRFAYWKKRNTSKFIIQL